MLSCPGKGTIVTYLYLLSLPVVFAVAIIAIAFYAALSISLKGALPKERAEILLALSKVFREWKMPLITVNFGRRHRP